jgi:hypothetical protein
MSHKDARSAGSKAGLPREVVHQIRNDLGTAIATADLLLLDRSLSLSAVRDVQAIRAACLKVMEKINAGALSQSPVERPSGD